MQLVTVRIKGKMDDSWADWFEGFELIHQGADETILSGVVSDQASFYGLIGKLRDLGLQLLEVSSTETADHPEVEVD